MGIRARIGAGMKKFLLGGGALVFLSASVPAFATDMPIKAPVYKAAAPFSWDGFYVGGHAGYGFGDFNSVDNVFVAVASGHVKPSGLFGGAQIGYVCSIDLL